MSENILRRRYFRNGNKTQNAFETTAPTVPSRATGALGME
jgi:hypothetical protein